ncbi:glutamate ABC transporter substrate-binding protein [Pseudonocardia sp. TRM90224]|uniref:glutamate ABC transporter substrate-binding protein n=1 Tax=Pseudonocardia sp. TRM90224 TaxID=2812678 RepID=UPI001E39D973|nr:glutamate ABC transporter substrate-binding protein [Pseudonocardia sp. TRM90224]
MRLSHFAKVAAVAAAAVLTATACGGQSPSLGSSGAAPSVAQGASFEAGTTMEKLNKAQALRLGTKFDQPLFGLKGLDGKPAGFDVEIAKIIAAKLGIPADKISYTEAPSAVREEVIEQDRVDMVVATYTINDKRKERITFAGPYYVAGQDLMVKSDNTTITGPESLKAANAKVCSVSGSTPSEKIKQYIDPANLTLFDVYSKCADALRTGQVDVVTTDNVILTGLIENSSGAFKLVNKKFTEEPYGIGVKKGDVKFCEFVNKTLKEAEADGSYKAAWDSTLAKVSPDVPPLPAAGTCS